MPAILENLFHHQLRADRLRKRAKTSFLRLIASNLHQRFQRATLRKFAAFVCRTNDVQPNDTTDHLAQDRRDKWLVFGTKGDSWGEDDCFNDDDEGSSLMPNSRWELKKNTRRPTNRLELSCGLFENAVDSMMMPHLAAETGFLSCFFFPQGTESQASLGKFTQLYIGKSHLHFDKRFYSRL